MVRILRHHGANYPLGLSSQGPTENPVLLPKDAIGFMRRFYKAATKQPVSTTRFHFELEATYLASAAGGRHIFEYRASPDMRALVLLTTTSGAGAGDVRMMLVFHELSTGMRLEFEQIFRGRGSYTKIGKEKSNPVEDTGVAYVFGGNTQTTYLGKDRENKLTGTSANIDVSDHFPNKPIKLTFKFYAAN